jgi:hypothetical protein
MNEKEIKIMTITKTFSTLEIINIVAYLNNHLKEE